ncbi:MAG: transporter associated domain-containing protein [Bacteroidota bacterium]
MDDPSKRTSGWTTALRIGSHHFPATFLLVLLNLIGAFSILPLLFYILGTGWVAPFVTAILFFLILMLFRNLIFSNIYRSAMGDGDAALLEYLVQQNNTGTAAEEELEMELLENALHLKQVRAQDCMAPRPEIVYVDVQDSVQKLQQRFIESSLSRVLVTDGELDRVLGYVHVQQMFARPVSIRKMVMPITFVPETIPVNDLLYKFIKNRTNIACVVDEYGSLAGLVTLEDVLEQLFGKIEDEHDQEEFIEAKVSETEFIFSGRLDISYLNEQYPTLNLPEGDYNTLSGYLVMAMQTIPEQGARLELDGKTFVLELVGDRKIETVRVIVNE